MGLKPKVCFKLDQPSSVLSDDVKSRNVYRKQQRKERHHGKYRNGVDHRRPELYGFTPTEFYQQRSTKMEERLHKLDKYYEAGTSKNQQRSELAINGRTGALNMKMTTRMKIVNQSVEDRPLKKRVRKSVSEFEADCQSNGLKKQHVAMAKHVNILKDNGEESDQFEKTRRLDSIEEGWVKKVKRKRSVGTILTRTIDSDRVPKRASQNKVVDESGSQKHDAYSPLTRKKAIRTSHENCEKSMVKERFVSQERGNNGEPSFGQWVGQRPPKVARTRRLSQDDCSPSNGTNDSPVSRNVASDSLKLIVKVHNVQSGSEESVGGERRLKGKMVNSEADGICGQKIGPCVTLGKKNKESVNGGTKKNGSKPGRRLQRFSEYKGLSDNAPVENSSSPDFTGGSDDDQEELPASANNAQIATPHQERKTQTPRQHFESFFKKHDMDHKTFNGPTPFYQRVLSALIIEDDDIDINELQEDYAKNIQIQNSLSASTSDTYHHNDSDSSKRARVENSQNTKFALCGQSEMLTGTSKSFHGCQYEQMCIDDKLLLELQFIGLCPDTLLPGLEDNEDEMIHHEVNNLNTTLHQQEIKKKACLEKRSLGRCHKFEKSVTSCFNETPLKDLFSAPIKNEPGEPKVLSDEAFTVNKPISNRGKNKKLLLNTTTTTTTISGEIKGKRSNRAATKPPRAPKPQPRQTSPHPPRGKSVIDQTNPPPSPLDELGGVVGGPHDLASLFSEEIPDVDMDFGAGLDVPTDDLTELCMF